MKKTPRTVEASIPPKTAVPSETRERAPAPEAMTSGMTPRMNEKAVIRMARKRRRAAVSAASKMDFPSSRSCLANSTIRMAVFAESPIRSTSPIWK